MVLRLRSQKFIPGQAKYWLLFVLMSAIAVMFSVFQMAALADEISDPADAANSPKSIGSTELISNASSYDGMSVSFEGEAIGDLMHRASGAWINVTDGSNAIGVFLSPSLAEKIKFTGDYKERGDLVQVVGIFNRADPARRGDLDIVATDLTIMERGNRKPEAINTMLIYQMIALGLLTVLLFFLSHFRHHADENDS